MLLVDEDVAAGERGLVEVPDQRLLLERQRREPVRIELHDGRVVDALEQVLALGSRAPGAGGAWGAGCGSGPVSGDEQPSSATDQQGTGA